MVFSLVLVYSFRWWCLLFFIDENPFLGKFVLQILNCWKWYFQPNSNMLNLMVIFTFSVMKWDYPFWAKFVQKFKIVCLSWNLVTELIRMCWIQCWCSLFFVLSWINYFKVRELVPLPKPLLWYNSSWYNS